MAIEVSKHCQVIIRFETDHRGGTFVAQPESDVTLESDTLNGIKEKIEKHFAKANQIKRKLLRLPVVAVLEDDRSYLRRAKFEPGAPKVGDVFSTNLIGISRTNGEPMLDPAVPKGLRIARQELLADTPANRAKLARLVLLENLLRSLRETIVYLPRSSVHGRIEPEEYDRAIAPIEDEHARQMALDAAPVVDVESASSINDENGGNMEETRTNQTSNTRETVPGDPDQTPATNPAEPAEPVEPQSGENADVNSDDAGDSNSK
jgi:hypothetical protein